MDVKNCQCGNQPIFNRYDFGVCSYSCSSCQRQVQYSGLRAEEEATKLWNSEWWTEKDPCLVCSKRPFIEYQHSREEHSCACACLRSFGDKPEEAYADWLKATARWGDLPFQKEPVVPEYLGDEDAPGVKHDSSKPLLGLMHKEMARALLSVSESTTYGASKYSEGNWLKLDPSRIADALHRHLNAHERGVEKDPESGLKHLTHAAWNVLALLELELRASEEQE